MFNNSGASAEALGFKSSTLKPITGGSTKTDTWRRKLIKFINSQPGSYDDEKWRRKYLETFAKLGLSLAEPKTSGRGLTTAQIDKLVSKNFAQEQNQKPVKKKKYSASQAAMRDGTGLSAVQLSSKFHENLVFIKRQLETASHPIFKIISYFRSVYSCQYTFLLLRNKQVRLMMESDLGETDDSLLPNIHKANTEVLKNEIKGFIEQIVNAVLQFYEIELTRKDIKRDLMVNMITNIVIREDIYFILFRIYSKMLNDDIQKMHTVLSSDYAQEHMISLASRNVERQFRMDQAFREEFPLKEGKQESIVPGRAYDSIITRMRLLDEMESPMLKCEHIYKCCTEEILKTLEEFWAAREIKRGKLVIGFDNLEGIVIYMLGQMKDMPQVLTHLALTDAFLPEKISQTDRKFYFVMMQSSC